MPLYRIEEVFADVPYPGVEDILGAPEHVQSCGECNRLQNALVGRTWKDLANDEARSGDVSHAMSFFSPSGWHYYLPAYLIQNVRRCIFSSIYFRPISLGIQEHLEQRAKQLTRAQCKVIIAYLLIAVREGQNSQREVDLNVEAVNYWKERCQNLSEPNESSI